MSGFYLSLFHSVYALCDCYLTACIYLGGFISDRISKTSPTFRPKLQFCAMLIGAPIVCMIGMASTLYAVYALFFAMGVCRGFYECNTHASVFETIPAKYRSSTVGVMILFAFLIGAWSAQMVGAFVDKYVSEFGTELGYELGYRYSFQILGATWILGAVCVGIAAFGTFKRDRERRIAMELAAEEAEKTAA